MSICKLIKMSRSKLTSPYSRVDLPKNIPIFEVEDITLLRNFLILYPTAAVEEWKFQLNRFDSPNTTLKIAVSQNKVQWRSPYNVPWQGGEKYSSSLSLTSALDVGVWSNQRLCRRNLPKELYRRLRGSQFRSLPCGKLRLNWYSNPRLSST